MSDMDAYKDVFLSESAEFIQAITDGLLALEESPHDLEPVEVIFRGAHSLKGMSAAMGYELTAELTHKMEGLMDRVRKHEREVDTALVDLMLAAVDAVKVLIDQESEEKAPDDTAPLIARIVKMTEVTPDAASDTDGEATREGERAESADGDLLSVTVTLEEACVLKAVRAYMVLKRLSRMGTVVDTEPSARDIEDERFELSFKVLLRTEATRDEVVRAITDVSEVEDATVQEATAKDASSDSAQETSAAATPARHSRRAEIPKLAETQTVRIAIGHLDSMVNLVGELVILRSRLDRIANDLDHGELQYAVEELHRVSGDLQQEVMDTRMVPVGNIFNRFPRMVRDLAHDLGKDVAFRMEGLDIELDRTVLDEIGDPIVHLLRNSIDHGVETPEAREVAGKAQKGSITLSARRDRDTVRIAVSDDGGGMDVETVWDKACAMGLARREDRSSMKDEDVLLMTCTPGFSTAKVTTKVSGRGVGMDAVKGKIEYLGGSMAINSRNGEGAEVVLTLPLTLAIIQALLVSTNGQTFALPLGLVDEVVAPRDAVLDTVDGSPVLIGRGGGVIPVLRLDNLLGMPGSGTRLPASDEHIVLIEDAGGMRRALVVGELLGRTEIVVKPLASLFRDVRGIGGATVLGDGRVALILDPRTFLAGREDGA